MSNRNPYFLVKKKLFISREISSQRCFRVMMSQRLESDLVIYFPGKVVSVFFGPYYETSSEHRVRRNFKALVSFYHWNSSESIVQFCIRCFDVSQRAKAAGRPPVGVFFLFRSSPTVPRRASGGASVTEYDARCLVLAYKTGC